MFTGFQIDNTPEQIRRARRPPKIKVESPKEPTPRLALAPFSRPPQLHFDNVVIGTTCERHLEVYNPTKQVQQITLGRDLPPGLFIDLPDRLTLSPEAEYTLTLSWTPVQPTALREILRFTDDKRGRYDVIVVLKTATINVKGKSKQQPKSFKISPPGKMKWKTPKKSPVAMYKRKSGAISKTCDLQTKLKSSNKENIPASNDQCMDSYRRLIQPETITKTSFKHNIQSLDDQIDQSIDSYRANCPFDSSNLTFNTSEIFSTIRKTHGNILQNTFENSNFNNAVTPIQNIAKSAKPFNTPGADVFDNLTFTPLKTGKLEKGPIKVYSLNSESDDEHDRKFDDSLDRQTENETHSIISVSTQPPNKWFHIEHQHIQKPQIQNNTRTLETLVVPIKKIPNTSSPKEMSSPNFSINTDFSRISELSFNPPRTSTDRKTFPKFHLHQGLFDEPYEKMNSDTYTKESPNTPKDYMNQMFERHDMHFMMKEPPHSRQALFKETARWEGIERAVFNTYEPSTWKNERRPDQKSPRTSLSPPLQSIPEESTQFSQTHILDKTDRKTSTFTINKTFEKHEKSSFSASKRQVWSKTAIRAEPELWKMPSVPRKSIKPKINTEERDSISHSMSATFNTSRNSSSITYIGNVYSQAATVDPFSSATYFYDEKAVHKFETEFKRWLNCILTPPADLESNDEQKLDVGKAWIENRNKEVPLAPTKEQVSSKYHDSQRLAKLRRMARNLLKSPEMTTVIEKLNAQIDKKLIAIRTDKNLHLDVGLQKMIMEILLSYNPLWLRIGLEAIYGVVLPLKSNSDVEGLTAFIIQRLFKNPFLKNKHTKSNAPNMLLPAYMEAIKKYTLKKFFLLAFFLDQAKAKKLIPHDPCLFCRNAVCKESREVIIRFTRELIAGIGDITKHLRPLGYVLTHKQSYLDEYKYAVHNLAVDIRDGVRLTKVMEIILMKDGLLRKLRTPAISRLQQIHNVKVALEALKEANFVISGNITATDVADGHREKTLSLLWQLIHEFRAPLFEQAATVIQAWWRKKYEVIVEQRIKEQLELERRHLSSSIIQNWWRKIQYNRMLECERQRHTAASIVVQKYWRMAIHRNRFLKAKSSVSKIEQWYISVKQMRAAKVVLEKLKREREELRQKSAIIIQSEIRRWICVQRFNATVRKVIMIQCLVRRYLARQSYLRLKTATELIQERYRGKLLMRQEMQKLLIAKRSATLIQSWFEMMKERQMFIKLKNAVKNVEERYIALLKMREEREKFEQIKQSATLIQARFRAKKCRQDITKKMNAIVTVQRKFRANQLMKEKRTEFFILRNATVFLQRHIRSYLLTKNIREAFLVQRKAVITIQQYYRSYRLAKAQRKSYLELRKAAVNVQNRYRSLLAMRKQRSAFLRDKQAAIVLQTRYRAQVSMKSCKKEFTKLKTAAMILQQRYRSQIKMRKERAAYLKVKTACVTIQRFYRAYRTGTEQRKSFLEKKRAAIDIQDWWRNCRKGKDVKQEFLQTKQACLTIQRVFRTFIIARKQRQEYTKLRIATICIQKYYRSYVEMKTVRNQYILLKAATVTIQRHFRSHMETKRLRIQYLRMKTAAETIQKYFRNYVETQKVREHYCKLKTSTILLQRRYRSLCVMRKEREQFLTLKKSATIIQQKYKATLAMRAQRQTYLTQISAAVTLQRRFRAQCLMRKDKSAYATLKKACVTLQRYFRAYLLGKKEKEVYTKLKKSAIVVQQRYRALLAMRKQKALYLKTRNVAITLQRRYRCRQLMKMQKHKYQEILKATITIQTRYKSYVEGKEQRQKYMHMKSSAIIIQTWIRNINETRKIRKQFLQLKSAAIYIQRRYKFYLHIREQKMIQSAHKIQQWYKATKKRNEVRENYLKLLRGITVLQSIYRMRVVRKPYQMKKQAVVKIQNFYRSHRIRQTYQYLKRNVIKIQSHARMLFVRKRFLKLRSAALTIQAAYRWKKQHEAIKELRQNSAIIIQRNVRRFLAETKYQRQRKAAISIKIWWRGMLVTRLLRCEFLQKRRQIIRIQAIVRGYLARKRFASLKLQMASEAEERRRRLAATVIQAFYRGHVVRSRTAAGARARSVRKRWRRGALISTQKTIGERREHAIAMLIAFFNMDEVIKAIKTIETITTMLPMYFTSNATLIIHQIHLFMSATNRSPSSLEVLKSAAVVLVNLTRYSRTGVAIYPITRENVPAMLKLMWRFSANEMDLTRLLCTHLWLFTKYPTVAKDLAEYLKQPENHKMLTTIKSNIERLKRMESNMRKNSCTGNPAGIVSHAGHNCSLNNYSLRSNKAEKIILPALEPDYGFTRDDTPQYFRDGKQAINTLFNSYGL